jgi:protein tyrosine phosphatase
VAYDRTRVLLDEEEYVNASLVQEPDVGVDLPRRWWIAAQVRSSVLSGLYRLQG